MKRFLGCLLKLCLLALLFVVVICVIVDSKFSVRSNLLFLEFRNSYADLQVRTADGEWKKYDSLSSADMEKALERNRKLAGLGMTWRTLPIRRVAHNSREKLLNSLLSSEIHIVEFDPDQFEFFPTFQRENGSFEAQNYGTAMKRVRKGNKATSFVINANYYDRSGQPLGWIVKDGETIRKRWKSWSGFFFVKGGTTGFGPTSLLEETPGEVLQATQGYPSVMKDGQVWNYVSNNRDQFFNGSELTFRSLAGVGEDGRIIFVLSGKGGLLNMGEVTGLAKLAGVRDATLLDGGRALQYGMKGPEGSFAFHSFNNTVDWKKLPAKLSPERPPVFLAVQRKE